MGTVDCHAVAMRRKDDFGSAILTTTLTFPILGGGRVVIGCLHDLIGITQWSRGRQWLPNLKLTLRHGRRSENSRFAAVGTVDCAAIGIGGKPNLSIAMFTETVETQDCQLIAIRAIDCATVTLHAELNFDFAAIA